MANDLRPILISSIAINAALPDSSESFLILNLLMPGWVASSL
jgi:hypothetical protein